MSIAAGEKFVVDISDDEEEEKPLTSTVGPKESVSSYGLLDDFVGDIVERKASAPKPPAPPTLKSTTTGFPEHKKRTKTSAFKQQRAAAAYVSRPQPPTPAQDAARSDPSAGKELSFEDNERKRIDDENNRKLADMSEEEIRQEREELLSSLSPELVQMMLRRANLNEARGDTWKSASDDNKNTKAEKLQTREPLDPEAVSIPIPSAPRHAAAQTVTYADDDESAPIDPGPLQTPSQFKASQITDATPAVHFPNPPTAPELDPSDPSFLENLHTKYFPSLPADPSKLAWMAPLPTSGSIADQESPYYPGAAGLNASALRFDFRGALLPPRISRAMPTNKGLHHHGEAPEAAGYTVPELARLARSVYPAQRCVAFQTLGRFLFRLGKGQFGQGTKNEISKGLWKCVEDGKVIETLEEAASIEGGHQGSKVYATEALWLWQKGGGKSWKAAPA